MKEKFKELINKLSNDLHSQIFTFLLLHADEIQKNARGWGEILDLVLSAHFSSLFRCLSGLSHDEEKYKKKTEELICDLKNFLSQKGGLHFLH